MILEIAFDLVSLYFHAKDSGVIYNRNSQPISSKTTQTIFTRHQDKFFTYNRTCWLIFLAGLGAIYIGLTNSAYLAATGIVLSLEHIIAAVTD